MKRFKGFNPMLFAAAVILTVISGVSYIVKNPAVLKTEK